VGSFVGRIEGIGDELGFLLGGRIGRVVGLGLGA